jgi:membrane-associated protease RseP (regulator of RpoE activity)
MDNKNCGKNLQFWMISMENMAKNSESIFVAPKEFSMKKENFFVAMLSMVLTFGMMMAGCTTTDYVGIVTPHNAVELLSDDVQVFEGASYDEAAVKAGEAGFEVIISYEGRNTQGLFGFLVGSVRVIAKDADGSRQSTAGWLGVSLLEIDDDMKTALKLDGQRGAFVSMVSVGSPAIKGGIRPGDFVTKINDKEISSRSQLSLEIRAIKVGEQVRFSIIRDGREMELTALIEARTNEVATDNSKLWPGLVATPITDSVRQQAGIGSTVAGLYVVTVVDKGPASIIGLHAKDVITGINGEAVSDLAAFYRILREKAGKELWFEVNRGGNKTETLKFER